METYKPSEVSCIVGTEIISGFADGEFIKADHNVDAQSLVIGGDGSGARVVSADESGFVEISLKSTSPSNQYLSSLCDARAVIPVFIKDDSGGDLATGKDFVIAKKPGMGKGKELTTNVWRLISPKIFINHGGNE